MFLYKKNAKMLFNASPRFFVGLVVLSLIVGVGLPYLVIVYGDFLDTLVGARGIEIFTTDARETGRRLLMTLGVVAIAIALLSRLQGEARRWTVALVEVIVVFGWLLIALPVAVIRVPLQIAVVLLSRAYHLGRWYWVLSVVILLAFIINAPAVVSATVYRELTVGEGMMFLLADVFLTLWSLIRVETYARHY